MKKKKKKNKDKDKFKVAQEGYQIESQAAQIVKNAVIVIVAK